MRQILALNWQCKLVHVLKLKREIFLPVFEQLFASAEATNKTN